MIYEIIIFTFMVAPAGYLALKRSSWLLDYTIAVVAFNRLIRRMVDYYLNEAFNPFSLISLTPIAVACLLAVPALSYYPRLSRQTQFLVILLIFAVGHGLAIGIISHPMPALFGLAEWLTALTAFAFAAAVPASTRAANRWISTTFWCGIGVAAYGWFQFLYLPPWDKFWGDSVNMISLGLMEPQKFNIFSTMGSRGPVAGFLAFALIPMLLSKQWRSPLGWAGFILMASAIILTQTRTMFIIIAVIALLQILAARGRNLFQVALLGIVLTLGFTYGLSLMPQSERFTKRYATFANMSEDNSLQGRLRIYQSAAAELAKNPLGYGLGASGLAYRLGDVEGHVHDAGAMQVFAQFGWLGGTAFFLAIGNMLWLFWKRRAQATSPFLSSGFAVLAGSLVFLFVGDVFKGFSLIWIICGRALHDSQQLPKASQVAKNSHTSPAKELTASLSSASIEQRKV